VVLIRNVPPKNVWGIFFSFISARFEYRSPCFIAVNRAKTVVHIFLLFGYFFANNENLHIVTIFLKFILSFF